MNRSELAVRSMLQAIEAPLYDLGVLSDRGMLPGLDSLTAEAVLCGFRCSATATPEVPTSTPARRASTVSPRPTTFQRHARETRA